MKINLNSYDIVQFYEILAQNIEKSLNKIAKSDSTKVTNNALLNFINKFNKKLYCKFYQEYYNFKNLKIQNIENDENRDNFIIEKFKTQNIKISLENLNSFYNALYKKFNAELIFAIPKIVNGELEF